MKYYVGIDLGGTNVRVCKMDENGVIVQDFQGKSHGTEGPKELIRDSIFALIDKIDLTGCEGIGIAIPGPVDTYNMVMPISNNLVGFENYPIADLIKEKYKIPVFLDNDANMAGLAEAVLGAGKDYPIVYYITHSTGVGGALVVNGHVVSGQLGFAGEISNIIVREGCQRYSKYLNPGSVESESSGVGLARKAVQLYGEGSSAKTIFEHFDKGETEAIKIVEEMAENMGRLLATIGQVVDPHVFVIGGGISSQSDKYWPLMEKYYHQYFNGIKPAKILKAKLKEPGVLGAAMLVKANGKV